MENKMSSTGFLLYRHVVRETLIPFVLIVVTIALAVVFPFLSIHRENQLIPLFQNPLQVLQEAWQHVNLYQFRPWLLICGTVAFASASILWFGGPQYYGPRSYKAGFRPQYQDSGLRFYLLAMVLHILLLFKFSVLPWYYQFVSQAACFLIFGLAVATLLFIKGHLAPSAGERSVTFNPLFDFYSGIELYPRIGKRLDLKQLINCRFGCWLWQLLILGAWKANYEMFPDHSFNYRLTVNVLLQTVYLAKFFYWESGYMQTIDTSVDHLGYYVGWGCIVWVPTFYTFSSISAVATAPDAQFGMSWATIYFLLGLIAIWLNYETDAQRQRVRLAAQQSKSITLWGKPLRLIRANYKDAAGTPQQTVLLAGGFWAWARHVNYLFELISALIWSAAVSNSGFQVFLYFIFLTVLLVHRAHRDEQKCSAKYGKYWNKYCLMVPYKILPYVY